MRFIGDIHGKFKQYNKIVKACDASIQVGDFGMGFPGGHKHPWSYKPAGRQALYRNQRFIRGNHDNPAACANAGGKWWIPDGTVEMIEGAKVMFCGGAHSIDQAKRLEGVSWWRGEELSIEAFNKIIDKYEREKPDVMVTHEAPEYIIRGTMKWKEKVLLPSRTRQAFQAMWEMHSPKLWVFGHWHQSVDTIIDGCRFVCLNELEYKDINLSEYIGG